MTHQTNWSIDQNHTQITFKIRHLMIAHVRGSFRTFDANIFTTDKDFKTAEIDLWIDASSIFTNNDKRDEHLRGSDFLDSQNHKQITFTSSTMGKADPDGNHELWGNLTIKGITKRVQMNVTFGGLQKDPWDNEKAGFELSGKIKRSDWGLTWNTEMENSGLMLGDTISILCEIELINSGTKEHDMVLETEKKAGV